MFRDHVKKRLSAYCNGQLAEDEARRVSEHLLACRKCRNEYEQINLGARLAGQLAKLSAPDDLWAGVEEQIESGHAAARARRGGNGLWASGWLASGLRLKAAGVAAGLLLVVTAGILFYMQQRPRESWAITVVDGVPKIGSNPVAKDGKLYVGQWLVTDQSSSAVLFPGTIGEVKVEPGSRVRVIRASQSEYRLSLEQGEVQAKISAPPRLFFVDTPSAEAIDLGCAYTLTVDSAGNGTLHVTSGWVELVLKGRVKSKGQEADPGTATIPAGAACLMRHGMGPGTPYFEDASPSLKAALEQVDFEGGGPNGSRALDTVLAEARKLDSLTLWHLLFRVGLDDRDRVYDRLAELVPPPEGANKDNIMQDQSVLDEWWLKVQRSWFD